ncbi:MAG: ABC transporter substrate-binding protein [Weeksellaceae bacterium]|nr:ABC transporter substrate-binding protein [Weeksellaceae bacterium]
MKSSFLFFLAIFLLLECTKEPTPAPADWQIVSDNVQFKEEGDVLRLKSGRFSYEIPASRLPFRRAILLNASLVGFFTELGIEEKIIGISSPEYIFSHKIQRLIHQGKIKSVGNEQKYDVEKIIALKPDAIFTNYVASFGNTYDLLKKNGIEIVFLDEYLEEDPLAKSKYLLVFGKLLGRERESASRFSEIQNSYNALKTLAQKSETRPLVLANEMYGNQWFLPGGKTNLARFISDANGQYINSENGEVIAVPMSFEEVFAKSQKAEYWVNVGNHRSKKELLQINPNYAKLKAYNEGKMYTVAGREDRKANDFFESGVVRADLVLKDYIRIFHPELLPDYNLTYLKELK